VLEVETALNGPRTYDSTGSPLREENQTVFKERINRDKSDPNSLFDDITVIDNALTGPWTVKKNYRRVQNPRPVWRESVCAENNNHVEIAKEG
jgi:hypothetical protein